MKESDLNQTAKKFLIDQGCTEIHGEVLDIDLVGKKGNILYAIELKTTLSIKVLEQAYNRKNMSNYVYVAVPYNNKYRHTSVLNVVYRHFLEHHGIGLILLHPEDKMESTNTIFNFYEIVKQPKLNRRLLKNKYIFTQLNDNTLNKDGGMTSYERFSPYKKMIEDVYYYLESVKKYRNNHSVSLEEIVDNVKSVKKHYADPKASLRQELSVRSNIEIIKVDRKNYYRLKG